MKKFIGVVVILAAIFLGSYYGMGIVTERTLKKNLAMVNQSNGLYVDIEQYNRGWFKSVALLNWRLHIPARVEKNTDGQQVSIPEKDYSIQMPLTIAHGPVILANAKVLFGLGYAYTDLSLPQVYAEQFDKQYSDASIKPRLNISVFVNYFNNCRLHINAPAFNLVDKQGKSQFQWLGLDSDVSISSKMTHVDGSVTIDGMSLVKDNMKAVMGKTVSDYDLNRTENGLYLGDANLSFPSLVVTRDDQKVFEIEQLDVHSSSNVRKGLFSSDFKSELDKMFAGGKVYGPGALEVSINKLDAQVLAQINEQITMIQQGSDRDRQQALLSLLPELPKLVSKGAEFEISKFSLVMPDGVINGDLQISLPSDNTANPFQLIQKIQGQGNVRVAAAVLKTLVKDSVKQKMLSLPAATTVVQNNVPATAGTVVIQTQTPVNPQDMEQQAATQADEKISSLVKAGLLSVQGTDYVLKLKLAQGQLSVNDRPFNPAMMQF